MQETETFAYPPDMVSSIDRAQRLRLGFWAILVLPFWGFGIATIGDGPIGPAGALGFSFMVVFFDLLLRRVENQSREMAKQHLEYDGLSLLRQVDGGGVLLGQIDLSRPFKVRYAYAAFGNATYEVSQQPSGTTPADIRFTSRINGAQRIVTKLLRYHEWPPGDSM